MTKEEALQMCLEYIETNAHERRCVRWAIKDALAEPDEDAIIIQYHEATIKRLEKRIEELTVQPEQEPMNFVSLLHEAEQIVQSKPTWKRFIDGTPLTNDIAVWMTVFAQDVARRTSPSPQRQPEERQPDERNFCPRCGKRTADLTTIHTCTPPQSQWVNLTVDELIDLERKHLSHENLTRAIEAKLKEKNT